MYGSGKSARTRARRLIGAVGLLGIVVGVAACGTPPSKDSFYKPPSPLPAGAPGDVIRSRTSVFTTDPVGKAPVANTKAWQVLYRSENALGAATPIGGMVIVPTTAWTGPGSRPLVTFGVGTRGIGDDCAPSYTLANGADYEGGTISTLVSKGWAVVVSDMEGLGTPGMHTYEVGRSQGKALLDAARAAERLPGTGLSAASPVGIMGYSQGGTSAGWAAQLAPTYAPELQVKGVSAGGVPADLEKVAAGLDGSAFFAFELFAAVGLDAAYPELQLQSYLNADGKQLYTDMQNICLVSVDVINGLGQTAFKHVTDFTTSNPLLTAAWKARLQENKLGATAPTVPVYQYHALVDEIIPFAQADDLHKAWCAKGAKVTWTVLPLAEHALGLVEGTDGAVSFLADRFAGKPATSNC